MQGCLGLGLTGRHPSRCSAFGQRDAKWRTRIRPFFFDAAAQGGSKRFADVGGTIGQIFFSIILWGYMVRKSLWHHFSSPQFWAPTGHVLSHYLPIVQFEKIGMEAVQTAWLLQLARRRKHKLTISI